MSSIVIDKKLIQSYRIIDSLRLPHGMYLASSSSDYSYTWLRDSFYCSLPYLNKKCNTYERTYWRILDMFKEYEWKLEHHTKHRPIHQHEYIHARYSAHDVREIDTPWGHSQNDAVGAILWGIGEGVKQGKQILRDNKDKEILQKLVYYLETLEYWNDQDSGMWEENRERRSSSIGACVAGLRSVSSIVSVPEYIVSNGLNALYELFPYETSSRKYDLAQLSLIYPYNIFGNDFNSIIVKQVEDTLLRERGVIRYKGDSYYSTQEGIYGRNQPLDLYYGSEAEWCFGFGFLAMAHLQLGNVDKAKYYVSEFEKVMLEDGAIPELYYAGSSKYNVNTPLCWANAMYIVSNESLK
ncbi:glycoside hydrolase family 15 protein [Paenibacillus sp. Marseille-Q4541]|uniref:glycoside hydrolase family 15 protein n=1 Tax=Paenibacillus sp. Marseille-Q4541 TaxID=2831522 RepID=UPI001BAC5C93|nr:glycoside hydrolase family 15 protein [Paenibacillus sp. Marseille-Q4541]